MSQAKVTWLLSAGLAAALGIIGLLICFTSQRSLETTTTTGYSAPALYNQANADERDGKTAQAIVGYERAQFLAPGDEKIRANLSWARSHAGLPAIAQSGMERAVSWASPNTMAWLDSLGLVLLGASWVCARSPVKGRTFGVVTGACGLAFMALSVTSAILAWQTSREAVVVTMDTPARISPTTVSEVSFKLPAGEIATMWGQHGNFVLVADASGHTGWVSQSIYSQYFLPGQCTRSESIPGESSFPPAADLSLLGFQRKRPRLDHPLHGLASIFAVLDGESLLSAKEVMERHEPGHAPGIPFQNQDDPMNEIDGVGCPWCYWRPRCWPRFVPTVAADAGACSHRACFLARCRAARWSNSSVNSACLWPEMTGCS